MPRHKLLFAGDRDLCGEPTEVDHISHVEVGDIPRTTVWIPARVVCPTPCDITSAASRPVIKKAKRYRYYVSRPLIAERAGATCGQRLPAASLEPLVVERIRVLLANPGGLA